MGGTENIIRSYCYKKESSSGDGGRFFFCGRMDVSEGKAGMEERGRRVFCKGGAETEGV